MMSAKVNAPPSDERTGVSTSGGVGAGGGGEGRTQPVEQRFATEVVDLCDQAGIDRGPEAGPGHESVEHAVASVEHRLDSARATLIGREVGGDLGIAKVDADDGIARRFEHRSGRTADP